MMRGGKTLFRWRLGEMFGNDNNKNRLGSVVLRCNSRVGSRSSGSR